MCVAHHHFLSTISTLLTSSRAWISQGNRLGPASWPTRMYFRRYLFQPPPPLQLYTMFFPYFDSLTTLFRTISTVACSSFSRRRSFWLRYRMLAFPGLITAFRHLCPSPKRACRRRAPACYKSFSFMVRASSRAAPDASAGLSTVL